MSWNKQVKLTGYHLKICFRKLKDDKEIVMAVINHYDGQNLKYTSIKLKDD